MVKMESSKLNLNKDFRRLYGRGRSYVHPALVTYIMQNSHGEIRYGITAGKKVGGAVERNRARRVIEAAFRECSGEISCKGADIVFVARGRTPVMKSTAVAAVMKQQLISGGLIPSDKR